MVRLGGIFKIQPTGFLNGLVVECERSVKNDYIVFLGITARTDLPLAENRRKQHDRNMEKKVSVDVLLDNLVFILDFKPNSSLGERSGLKFGWPQYIDFI